MHCLRRGTPADLDALERLEIEGFARDRFSRNQLRYLLLYARSTTWLIEKDRRIVAAAIMLWRHRSMRGRLYSIVVDEDFRGRGFGHQLLLACESEAAERGCNQLTLEVRADNTRAIDVYRQHGFAISCTLNNYYEDGTDGLKMTKTLNP